jgi:hypothetical protein
MDGAEEKMPGRAFFAEPSLEAVRSNRKPVGDRQPYGARVIIPSLPYRIDPSPLLLTDTPQRTPRGPGRVGGRIDAGRCLSFIHQQGYSR